MPSSFFRFTRDQWAWSFYDWANSAFSTTIMAGFFPLFFKNYYAAQYSTSESTAMLAYANALALFCVFLTAPAFGRLTDQSHNKKKLLLVLTVLGSLSCLSLNFLVEGAAWWAAFFFAVGNFSFASACGPYDSLMESVASNRDSDRVSSLGYALGYLGGGILFALNLLMYQNPGAFFLYGPAAAIQASFASVGIWWFLFSLPLLIWVKEKDFSGNVPLQGQGFFKSFWGVLNYNPTMRLFLIAFFLYADGLGTIVRMAVDYGISIGLEPPQLMLALLAIQFIGFPATLATAKLVERFPPKNVVLVLVINYVAIVIWASLLRRPWEFFGIVLLLGISQGGIQALSRSLYYRLVPPARAGEFFGVYNILGKFAGVFGSLLMGTVTWLSQNHRLGLASVALIFIAGAWLLSKVDVKGETASGLSVV